MKEFRYETKEIVESLNMLLEGRPSGTLRLAELMDAFAKYFESKKINYRTLLLEQK
jgi:hypothetical protein